MGEGVYIVGWFGVEWGDNGYWRNWVYEGDCVNTKFAVTEKEKNKKNINDIRK